MGGFGAEAHQIQQGFGEGSGEGVGGFAETQLRCFQRLASQHASERFVKIKCCGCWGYHRSFF